MEVRVKVRIVDRPTFNFIIVKKYFLNPHHPLRLRTEFNFRESMEFLYGFLTYNDAIRELC